MLQLDDLLPDAPFVERHSRVVNLPIDVVWPAVLQVRASEIRLFGPLMALRHLPHQLARRDVAIDTEATESLLDLFENAGFAVFRRDDNADDGKAMVLAGAAGRFWRLAGNSPLALEGASDFLACTEPNLAKTVFSLEAVSRGARTELITETRVAGTDRSSTRKFGMYWAIIRGPSGLIRRSWLAAIERRAHR